jgi:hypothetical protein
MTSNERHRTLTKDMEGGEMAGMSRELNNFDE